jgi:hypothetical protein
MPAGSDPATSRITNREPMPEIDPVQEGTVIWALVRVCLVAVEPVQHECDREADSSGLMDGTGRPRYREVDHYDCFVLLSFAARAGVGGMILLATACGITGRPSGRTTAASDPTASGTPAIERALLPMPPARELDNEVRYGPRSGSFRQVTKDLIGDTPRTDICLWGRTAPG